MEVLVLDGKNYVKASKAARDLGYTTDYVGQLCRSGQINAHLIGRTWYVDQEQLGTHRVEKKRMSRTKAREQAKALIQSTRAQSTASQNASRNIPISYENDASPLIPETRKLSISSELYRVAPPLEESSINVIENKGKKVLMSGDLKIVDVTDAPLEEDTIILRPHIMRSQPVPAVKKAPAQSVRVTPTLEPEVEIPIVSAAASAPVRFTDRLQDVTEAPVEPPQSIPIVSNGGSKYSFFMHALLHVVILSIVLASLPAYMTLTYDSEKVPMTESKLNFSIAEAIKIFQDRF